MNRIALLTATAFYVTTLGTTALGTPVIDGTAETEYGAALAFQNTQTNFGNNDDDLASYANGSELDVARSIIDQGILYIHLSGTLESNWNKLDLFIDARPGGQQRILGINPDVDYSALQRMGDDGSGNGLTFDKGFEADYWVTVTCGDYKGTGIQYHASSAELRNNGDGTGGYIGMGTTSNDSDGSTGITPIYGTNGIEVAINNSNTQGVDGGIDAACGEDAQPVGIEIAIPLWLIDWDFEGLPFDDIRFTAIISSSDHSFVSNQVLGGIGGGDNLGEVRDVNFGDLPGNQFFSLGIDADACPEVLIGACCFANGECWQDVGPENCDLNRGLWIGEGTLCEDCNLGGPNDCPTDSNGDGVTNVDDLLDVIGHFNEVCP